MNSENHWYIKYINDFFIFIEFLTQYNYIYKYYSFHFANHYYIYIYSRLKNGI